MSFSALQRAENSSIFNRLARRCTSRRFSALQRAENSSICRWSNAAPSPSAFQCSSASRKFLNAPAARRAAILRCCFSALQRAENSSINRRHNRRDRGGEFQCSSASRKFLNRTPGVPKRPTLDRFQCSSASRKFLNRVAAARLFLSQFGFSALQRAENSSIIV